MCENVCVCVCVCVCGGAAACLVEVREHMGDAAGGACGDSASEGSVGKAEGKEGRAALGR